MKTIAVFTTTRAEFGIFKPLLNEIKNEKELKLLLFVGGTHLTKEHGHTINEIKEDNFEISATFDYLLNDDSPYSLAKAIGIETMELSVIFNTFNFDAVTILGDRYELLPIVQTAILFRKPIIHIHGGEKSEGAIDEQIRHMITKAAHLHFAACEEYAQNIIKLGEDKSRVFNTGALAVDNMLKTKFKNKQKILSELGLRIDLPVAIMTYHPVTVDNEIPATEQIKNIFAALETYNIQIVITAPNIDADRDIIEKIIKEKADTNKNYHYIKSLGARRFHNLLKYSEFMIGNSSSGIIEAPLFKIPTINIGTRQNGRIRHKSVIDTGYGISEIKNAIEKALNPSFRENISRMTYKFGSGDTAKKMVSIIKNTIFDNNLLKKKLTFEQ